jgi:hypothetical protein
MRFETLLNGYLTFSRLAFMATTIVPAVIGAVPAAELMMQITHLIAHLNNY